MRRRIATAAVAIVAAVFGAGHSATAAQDELVAAGASAAASISNCRLGMNGGFSGLRDSRGVISGTWTFVAATTCSGSMLRQSVVAQLVREKTVTGTSPAGTCTLALDDRCRQVATAGSLACFGCNGTWRIRSIHVLEFPLARFLTTFPRQSTPDGLSRIMCRITSRPLVLA